MPPVFSMYQQPPSMSFLHRLQKSRIENRREDPLTHLRFMDTETSPFETSEMLASSFASTTLLHDSWRLCNLCNVDPQRGFVTEQIGDIGYVAFSGTQLGCYCFDPWHESLVALDSTGSVDIGLFTPLRCQGEEENPAPMLHAGFLQIFLSIYHNPGFQQQMSALKGKCRSIIITGHSMGGATATLCALWLLSELHSTSSHLSILCITFGSPLLGNESLSRAILRERWVGNFCNVVSKYDVMPRLLFAPLAQLAPQLHSLLQYWNLSMAALHLGSFPLHLHEEIKSRIFNLVLTSLEVLLEQGGNGAMTSSFWPFGNYLFCTREGAICLQNATSVIKILHLLFQTGLPDCSIEDHLKYGDYVRNISSQFMMKRSFVQGELPDSSYEASVALALQSSGIGFQESIARPAKDCLSAARQMGRTPNLNSAKLAIRLSQITPYRAEIEWYKACSDRSDDQLGYYDSFKQRGSSIRDSKVNMNRHKLAKFWDNVIRMLDTNQLPHDFHRHKKWINASQFYKLLVEPLDIAEYYRNQMHLSKGHYISNGRERRYQIFDRWWESGRFKEEQTKRSKFASLTQDSCFWARVEEAKEWLDNAKRRSTQINLDLLWQKLDRFARYASELVEKKEVSMDVIAKNSSYTLWVNDYHQLRSQMAQSHSQLRGFLDGGAA